MRTCVDLCVYIHIYTQRAMELAAQIFVSSERVPVSIHYGVDASEDLVRACAHIIYNIHNIVNVHAHIFLASMYDCGG